VLVPLLHGAGLALGLILPLGPQNAFVFSQGAVQPRFARALPVVVAASLCDTPLILLAVLGVSAVVLTVPGVRAALLGAGVLFLLWIGRVTWRSGPASGAPDKGAAGWPLRRQLLFAVSVSLLNPHAILDTVAVVGTNSLAYAAQARAAYTAACVMVSWLWFLGLAAAGRVLGALEPVREVLGKVSALIMWGTALYLARQFWVAG
jgi:L-lysine exporter family protein LysE/ArgO